MPSNKSSFPVATPLQDPAKKEMERNGGDGNLFFACFSKAQIPIKFSIPSNQSKSKRNKINTKMLKEGSCLL